VTFDCASVGGKAYQGHCYYPRSIAVDWNTANTTACETPAHLVTITTAGEQAVVASLLSTQDRWIGMRRPVNSPEVESSYYWVTNEPLSYRNWDVYSDADREPNYTGECVRIRFTNRWADVVCTEALAVICERE
jgi:Lectin C-type domain